MKKRRATTSIVAALVLAVAGTNMTTNVVKAEEETSIRSEATTTTVTEATTTVVEAEATSTQTTEAVASVTTTETETITNEEPKVGDVVWVMDSEATFWAADRMFKTTLRGTMKYDIYIIDRYDEENWRINIPMLNQPEIVLLMPVEGYDIKVQNHDGHYLGDLCYDNVVNAFDMIMMRQAMFMDWDLDNYDDIPALIERSWQRQLADVNSDQSVNIADLVSMSNFLLGRSKTF